MKPTKSANTLLVEAIVKYRHDPLGYVLFAFPWGEPGELEQENGPRAWQRAVLKEIGEKIATAADENEVVRKAIASGHAAGKALCNQSLIETPQGIKKHGDLQVGDFVFGSDGKPTRIIQTHQFYDVPMYRVTFDDGTTCDCSSDHLWNVRGRQQRRKGSDEYITMSALDIVTRGVQRPNGSTTAKQWEIPVQHPVERPMAELPIDPYLFGMWLGNGSRGTITNPMLPEMQAYADRHGIQRKRYGDKLCEIWRMGKHRELRALGVLDKRSWEKSIPRAYLEGSIGQRAALLAGLMDTDGCIGKQGCAQYDSTSEQLCRDVMELARSLGGKAQMQSSVKDPFYRDSDGEKVHCRPCYRVTIRTPFNPFLVANKACRWAKAENRYLVRWIESIEPIPNASHCQCITVEAADGLYIANDYIVTHNSAMICWLLKWAIDTHPDTRGVVTANTETQLRTKTWPELGKWHRLSITEKWFTYTQTALISTSPNHSASWRIDAVTWSEHNTEAFAGLHNKGNRLIVLFDEASNIAKKVWEVAEGALTDENTEIIWLVAGNPTKRDTEFFNCFNGQRHRWSPVSIDTRKVEGTNKKLQQQMIDDYGEDSDRVRVRIKGEFPRSNAAQFITQEDVDVARRRVPAKDAYSHAALVIGVDVARHGKDSAVILVRQGIKILEIIKVNVPDLMKLAFNVIEAIEKHKPDAVFIDATGMGYGVYDRLKQLGHKNIYAVQVGEKAVESKRFHNLRAELWSKCRDWVRAEGCLPDNPDLITDIVAPEFFHDNTDRIQIESKEDMADRDLASPDNADALCLTFYTKVVARQRDETPQFMKRIEGLLRPSNRKSAMGA